ncbi:MAG: hypothetical protein Q7J54_03985 [Candidatus Woesearchaeota archaeon]|nr:hypothetical protein [Candidatus Woesearchaeota archaeon]
MTKWGNQKDVTALESEDKPKKCPDCGGKIVFEDGELICRVCGLIVE